MLVCVDESGPAAPSVSGTPWGQPRSAPSGGWPAGASVSTCWRPALSQRVGGPATAEAFRKLLEKIAEGAGREVLLAVGNCSIHHTQIIQEWAGGEPNRTRALFSADLLTSSQSGETAMGLGPAASPSPAEQGRSTASRQPGSCLPVFARSSGTGASLLSRGRLPVYSCLNSDDTTFNAISKDPGTRRVRDYLRDELSRLLRQSAAPPR